jgi:hypothetical protein
MTWKPRRRFEENFKLSVREVDVTGSGSCPMMGFGISVTEFLYSLSKSITELKGMYNEAVMPYLKVLPHYLLSGSEKSHQNGSG